MRRGTANAQFCGLFEVFHLAPMPFRFATIVERLKLIGRGACPRVYDGSESSSTITARRPDRIACPFTGRGPSLHYGIACLPLRSGGTRRKAEFAVRNVRRDRQNLFVRYGWSHR